MALFVTLPAEVNEKEVKDFLTVKYPGSTAEHWVDDFAERDAEGNFRELNLAIPGPPVSKEYWEWHTAKAQYEAENDIDMMSREELVVRINKLTGGRLDLK